MNVNFKYKDSCSQKPDQDETILSFTKIYKIDKNAALATIIFLLIQYIFFIVIKKMKFTQIPNGFGLTLLLKTRQSRFQIS